MKRQGLIVTIKKLENLTKELIEEIEEVDEEFRKAKKERRFQINIINKKGLSDTWEIEGK